MNIQIEAQKKFIPSVDRTGKRLTEGEVKQIASSSLVGSLQVKVWSEGIAVLQFRANVVAGKKERFVSFPVTKLPDGTWKRSFELGDDLRMAIESNGLRAMRMALTEANGSFYTEVEL